MGKKTAQVTYSPAMKGQIVGSSEFARSICFGQEKIFESQETATLVTTPILKNSCSILQ